MSAQVTAQTIAKPTYTPIAHGLLQRCTATMECDECRKKREGRLQRAAVNNDPIISSARKIQTKLTINKPGDEYEQEADRIADQVLSISMRDAINRTPPHIQRFTGHPAGQTEMTPSSVDQALATPGSPLEPMLRHDMEQRFGYDFSQVRVHTDPVAQQSAQDVNAHAYTVGQDIVFGAGRFTPGTYRGQKLIAHELTHTLQQGMARTAMLQRQEAGPSTAQPVPGFGDFVPEPSCPPTPTNLGNQRPDPPCSTSTEEISGDHFEFCVDSDVFASDQQQRLIEFVRRQRADTLFTVHGYASQEDGVSVNYNWNLSCHRAKRAARTMQNAGVASQQIQIAARGQTRKFGAARKNRIVVVAPSAQPSATIPTTTPATPRQVVDQAVARILARDYRLAADAYVARWTCGRIPTLAEIVRRTTILIEGQDRNATVSRDPLRQDVGKGGHTNLQGLREIVLAREIFTEASDPVSCAAARIIDLAFHHFIAPPLGLNANDKTKVHPAAVFLVELAGFPPCSTPPQRDPSDPSLILIPAQRWWTPLTQDPLANDPTGCLGQPLPGALSSLQQQLFSQALPTFNITNFTPESGAGPIQPVVNPRAGIVRANSPRSAFAFEGSVVASGNLSSASRYRVGFLQTVVADETVVEYVGGEAVHLAVPVPMRDGPPRSLDQPPWYMPPLTANLNAQGVAQTRMSDAPGTQMPYEFVNPELFGRVAPRDQVQSGNVVNRARVRTTFHTWLAARRDDAPLDRFNTHFLQGNEVSFNLDVDVVGTNATGTYQSVINPMPLTDPTPMQLAGPTPAEIDPIVRTTHVTPAAPRAQAGGISLDEFRQRVRQTAAELAPLRETLGLTGQLMVRIRVNPETGRLLITTPDRPTVTLEETQSQIVSEAGRQQFANQLLIRLRKDLVLAPMSSRDVAQVPIPTVLSPLPRHRPPQADDNPFSPEHGIGLLGQLRENAEQQRSAQQLQNQPDIYDPNYWPQVNVLMTDESYCYDFTVSGLDISSRCADESMRTEGCVRFSSTPEFTLGSNPTYRNQQLGGETFHSPVALEVTTFPVRFTLFTPRENPGGYTFNHEMHHLVDSYELVKALKERLARRIRARLMSARRMAADNPNLKDELLSRETISEMVQQEESSFVNFVQSQFNELGNRLHAREGREGGLPPYQIPSDWTDFHRVQPRGGARGSFTSRPCR